MHMFMHVSLLKELSQSDNHEARDHFYHFIILFLFMLCALGF